MNAKILFILIPLALSLTLISCNQAPKGGNENSLSEVEKTAFRDQGKAIAGATFTALSGQLKAAMQEGGVEQAIQYCNLNAAPIVDSLSKAHNAIIGRTTLRERNPQNAPTKEEKSVLEAYRSLAAAGGELKPVIKQLEGQDVAFYAPIRVNAFCLQCHGKVGETLQTEDYAVIQQHYPADKAIDYADGDLRGMWSIRFKQKSEN